MPFNPQGNITYGTYLQGNIASGTAQSTTLAYPLPTTQGSLLIAVALWNLASGSLVVNDINNSVSPFALSGPGIGVSAAVNPWIPLPPFVNAGDATTNQVFYIPSNLKGGPDQVLFNFSASQTFTIAILEYFGGGKYLNQATLTATSAGAALEQTTVPMLSAPPSTAFMEWDRASDFQGALAQSQIQQPGVLLVGSFRTGAALGAAGAGVTNRQTTSFVSIGDTGTPLLSVAAAPNTNVGWNLTGIATCDLIVDAFYVPNILGHPL